MRTTMDELNEPIVKVPLIKLEEWVDACEQICDPQVPFRESHMDEALDALRWNRDLAKAMIEDIQEILGP